MVRDIRAAAAQFQKNLFDITKEDFPPQVTLFRKHWEPRPEGAQPDPEAQEQRQGSQPMTINSSLSDQLESLSATEREAWRESSARTDRLDGHCRPRGDEPEPKRSRPELGGSVGGLRYPQSLPTPPGADPPIPTTPESLPPVPTTPQSMPPVPVSSGSSLTSFGTAILVTGCALDSASQNVSLHEQGPEEDVNFVLCSEESAIGDVHVLLGPEGNQRRQGPRPSQPAWFAMGRHNHQTAGTLFYKQSLVIRSHFRSLYSWAM